MTGKEDTLSALDSAYDDIHSVVSGIDEPHGAWEGAVGTWSVVNVLQHVDGWLHEMTEALQRMARGERPLLEGTDYNNVDAWNAKFVEVRGKQSFAEALAAFENGHAAFRKAAEAIPEERFGEGKTINRLIFGVCLEHYPEHAAQIRAYLAGESQ